MNMFDADDDYDDFDYDYDSYVDDDKDYEEEVKARQEHDEDVENSKFRLRCALGQKGLTADIKRQVEQLLAQYNYGTSWLNEASDLIQVVADEVSAYLERVEARKLSAEVDLEEDTIKLAARRELAKKQSYDGVRCSTYHRRGLKVNKRELWASRSDRPTKWHQRRLRSRQQRIGSCRVVPHDQ